jgi:hypothetical protein
MNYSRNYLSQYEKNDKYLNNPYFAKIFSDPHEFLSYGLTGSQVQHFLAQIPAENQEAVKEGMKRKSVLTDFMDTILNMLKEYFNKIFNVSDYKDYVEKTDVIASTLSDLMLTVQDSLLDPPLEKGNPIIHELNEADLAQHSNIKESNVYELKKEEEHKNDFNKTFPDYDYLNDTERAAYQDAIDAGYIQLQCGI